MERPHFAYYNAVDQIFHTEWSARKLARLELLAESIATLWPHGHPTRLIHVAGTGGKGSTCRFLEVGCGCAGTAGAFMSPHLFDYCERFSVQGQFVSRDDVTEAWETRVRPHCVRLALRGGDQVHTFHEVSILIALSLFEKYGVAWAAMETGVGGRYDQTRALDVAATVLTNVGSDHAHMLGRDAWQRALDKAGIARPGVPFFTTERNPQLLQVIEGVCAHVGAPLHIVDADQVTQLEARLMAVNGQRISAESLVNADYQKWNAALSLAALRTLLPAIDETCVLNAFLDARLLGRFWRVDERVYADIAHNAEKIGVLAAEIEKRFAGQGKILIMGLSGRRVPAEVFAAMAQVAKAIIVTGASYKGQDPGQVRHAIEAITGATPTLVIGEPQQALQVAKSMQGEDDVVILTGSTYMIEQVLNPDPYMRYLNGTFGWRMQTNTEATGTVHLSLPKPPSVVR